MPEYKGGTNPSKNAPPKRYDAVEEDEEEKEEEGREGRGAELATAAKEA